MSSFGEAEDVLVEISNYFWFWKLNDRSLVPRGSILVACDLEGSIFGSSRIDP